MALTTRGDGAVPTPEGVLGGPVVFVLDPKMPGRAPITFNDTQTDADGVEWWGELDGWEFPDVEVSSMPRSGRDGVWTPPGWYRARTGTLRGTFVAATLAAAQRAIGRVAAIADMTKQSGLLTVYEQEPTQTEVRLAGRLRFDRSIAMGRHVPFEIPITSADHRRYAVDEQSITFGVTASAAAGTGLELPIELPFDFGGEGTITGGTDVTVGGTIDTPPHFTFRGPCTRPRITNITSGLWWEYAGSLLAGEHLDVDVDAATVLLGGTANRYYLVEPGSSWWYLHPGRNVLTYAAAGAGTGDVTVRWRSAWL